MSEKDKPSEKKFEDYIENYILKNNYENSKNEDYDKELCIIKKNLLAFIKDTQETKWKSLKNIIASNYEVIKSIKENNLKINLIYIFIKILRKIFQVKLFN